MYRTFRSVVPGIGALVVLAHCVYAAELDKATRGSSAPLAKSVELFDGMKSGDLDVRFIAKNDREAQLIIKNTLKQPVNVDLPDAFAAVPVLAQIGGGGGGFGGGGGGAGGGQQAAGGGGGGGGGGGLGGGGFNIPPETTSKLKMSIVCLEHGKKDPNPHVPYEIRPIEAFTQDRNVHELLRLFGEGKLHHRAAQAAVWHFTDAMSWSDLAAKKIDKLGRPDEPYFTHAELQLAVRIAGEVERLAQEDRAETQSEARYEQGSEN